MDQQPLANIFAWLRAWISKLNEESFAKISAGIQSIVTALGIVVGGGWVLYTFGELGAVQKSRAEIAALEHQAIQEPVLLVDIKVDPT